MGMEVCVSKLGGRRGRGYGGGGGGGYQLQGLGWMVGAEGLLQEWQEGRLQRLVGGFLLLLLGEQEAPRPVLPVALYQPARLCLSSY